MKNAIVSRPSFHAAKSGLNCSVLALSLAVAGHAGAAELIKADNTTNLALQAAYTNAAADTGTADTIRFDNTLANNGTFSWSADNVAALKVVDPGLAITINMTGGSTYGLTNTAGAVIDMSAATQNLTLSNGTLRLRGDAVNGATIAIAAGRTLNVQTKLTYNNGSGLANIRVTGAGNLAVGGTNGLILDKDGSNFTTFTHDGTGTVTFSNANTYSGGTALKSGTLVAGNATALGNGAVTVSGGTLDLNGANALTLSLASGKSFTMSGGTLNFTLGSTSDQISGAGSAGFILSGGILALTLGSGFDYNTDYQLFSGFSGGLSSVSGLTITGYDTVNFTASLSSAGLLEFTAAAVPEPSVYASIFGGLALAACAVRRRR